LTELHKISIGIGLTCPIGLTLRTCAGDKIVKIDYSQGKDWERSVLEKSLSCTVSSWRIFEDQHDKVQISLKICLTCTPKNYSFICISRYDIANVDINGRYIDNDTFVEELKPTLSRLTTNFIINLESEDLKSSIVILRIISPPQSSLSLIDTISHLLVRISNSESHPPSSRISLSLDNPHQIETKMKSARGIEYSKPTTRTLKKLDAKVSMDNPGVEYNQKVFPIR
jgi:hypothetical protein